MRHDRHDGIFRALPAPTRRSILERLQQRELTVLELCEPFRITQPSLSKHLAVLRRSGLIVARRSGRHRYYRLDPKPLEQIAAWAAQFRDVRDRSGHVWRLSQINQRKDTCDGHPRRKRSEEHTSELQSRLHIVCRLLLEK